MARTKQTARKSAAAKTKKTAKAVKEFKLRCKRCKSLKGYAWKPVYEATTMRDKHTLGPGCHLKESKAKTRVNSQAPAMQTFAPVPSSSGGPTLDFTALVGASSAGAPRPARTEPGAPIGDEDEEEPPAEQAPDLSSLLVPVDQQVDEDDAEPALRRRASPRRFDGRDGDRGAAAAALYGDLGRPVDERATQEDADDRAPAPPSSRDSIVTKSTDSSSRPKRKKVERVPFCVEFADREYASGGSRSLCPFPGCKEYLVVKCPVDPLTGRIKLLDDDGNRLWIGHDACRLSNHFRAPLNGHGREGVQMLLDAGIKVGQKGRRAGLKGEDALKSRKATPVASGLRPPSRRYDYEFKPEVKARSRRLVADRCLTSRPVEHGTRAPLIGNGRI